MHTYEGFECKTHPIRLTKHHPSKESYKNVVANLYTELEHKKHLQEALKEKITEEVP